MNNRTTKPAAKTSAPAIAADWKAAGTVRPGDVVEMNDAWVEVLAVKPYGLERVRLDLRQWGSITMNEGELLRTVPEFLTPSEVIAVAKVIKTPGRTRKAAAAAKPAAKVAKPARTRKPLWTKAARVERSSVVTRPATYGDIQVGDTLYATNTTDVVTAIKPAPGGRVTLTFARHAGLTCDTALAVDIVVPAPAPVATVDYSTPTCGDYYDLPFSLTSEIKGRLKPARPLVAADLPGQLRMF